VIASVYVHLLLHLLNNVNQLMCLLNGEHTINVVSFENISLRMNFDRYCIAMQCENGKIYMACGPICQTTCQDIYLNDNYNCIESGCQEGCFCPDGQVMDETGTCVMPLACPCMDQNIAYPVGSKIIRNCDEW
jgi:hypothetical protein